MSTDCVWGVFVCFWWCPNRGTQLVQHSWWAPRSWNLTPSVRAYFWSDYYHLAKFLLNVPCRWRLCWLHSKKHFPRCIYVEVLGFPLRIHSDWSLTSPCICCVLWSLYQGNQCVLVGTLTPNSFLVCSLFLSSVCLLVTVCARQEPNRI